MKYRSFLILILIGCFLAGLLVWSGTRRSPEPLQEYTEVVDVDPRWAQLNPSDYESLEPVFIREFAGRSGEDFHPRETIPPGKTLKVGEEFSFQVSTEKGSLGLVLEARAATPGQGASRSRALIYREGVNLKPPLPDSQAPILEVSWDGEKLGEYPLKTLYWESCYAGVRGDGKTHDIQLKLRPPNGNGGQPSRDGMIKKIELFSLDDPQSNQPERIGLLEAGLRAEALDRKIIILGLDGITWQIVDPLLAQGKMPNLKKLIDSGVRGTIVDKPPLDSVKIWTTIATGRRPENHGIDRRVYRGANSSEPIPVNSTLRKTKALWNQFSDMGRTVGFLGWFASWPAESVNGFMVTERAPFAVSHAVYPEVLGRDRQRHLAGENDLMADDSPFAEKVRRLRRMLRDQSYPAQNAVDEEEFRSMVQRAEEVYFTDAFYQNFAMDLYQRYSPSLFGLYFHGTDGISHAFYKFRFPEQNFEITPEQVKAVGDVIAAVYQHHDRTLGRLMDLAGPGVSWIVLSDHGFQRQFSNDEVDLDRPLLYDMDSILESLGLLVYDSNNQIDWSRTTCFTSVQTEWNPRTFIRLNVAGRQPEGMIAPEDQQRVQQEVLDAIQSVRFKESGRPVFSAGQEIPEKKFAQEDIRAIPRFEPGDFSGNIIIGNRTVPVREVFSVVPLSGTHRTEGVVVFSGPGFRSGVKLEKPVRTMDVAPTVLALSGLPVGEDLDGEVVKEVFTQKHLKQIPVRYIPSYEFLGRPSEEIELTEQMDEATRMELDKYKAIGYLR